MAWRVGIVKAYVRYSVRRAWTEVKLTWALMVIYVTGRGV